MNEHDDVICQVRESFTGLRMDTRVEDVFARSQARRRRMHRVSGAGAELFKGTPQAGLAIGCAEQGRQRGRQQIAR